LTASSLNSGVYSRFGMFFIFFPFKNNVNFTSPLEDYFSGEAHHHQIKNNKTVWAQSAHTRNMLLTLSLILILVFRLSLPSSATE